ncbi:MAG: RHS repeat domain-containing protein, partial [Pirellula sp.]
TNWKYDPTNQLTVDNYLPATGGVAEKSWASLTLFQWDQFTLAQWNTLPLDPTSFVAGSSRLAYSPVGNRSVRIDSDSGTPTTFTYNCGNQVLEAEDPSGVTTYTYDANGNRLTIEEPSLDITTNTWDCENRLVMVEHPDGSVIEYRYNGDGHRVEQLLDSVSEKKWIYDGNTMLMETDGSGTVETAYTYKPGGYGRMVSQRQGSDSSFAHFDGVKNLRMLTDDTGMVTDEYDFDAFGSELSTSGSTLNAHRWKGESLAYYREPDAAPSLQYALHFRNYDPLTGTFPSRDPAEDDSNLYRYVKNNPLNASDPSGLQEPFKGKITTTGVGFERETPLGAHRAGAMESKVRAVQEIRERFIREKMGTHGFLFDEESRTWTNGGSLGTLRRDFYDEYRREFRRMVETNPRKFGLDEVDVTAFQHELFSQKQGTYTDVVLTTATGFSRDEVVLAWARDSSALIGVDQTRLTDDEILNHPGRWGFDFAIDVIADPMTYTPLTSKGFSNGIGRVGRSTGNFPYTINVDKSTLSMSGFGGINFVRKNSDELLAPRKGLIKGAAEARQKVRVGDLAEAPHAVTGGRPGHVKSSHGWDVNDPKIVEIRNNPDKIYISENPKNPVTIFWKDGDVVIAETSNPNLIRTAYGKSAPKRAQHKPDVWANDPNYLLVE